MKIRRDWLVDPGRCPAPGLQHASDWERAGEILADAARRLAGTGADFLVLCTNTMHKVAPAIERTAGIPLLHIANATAAAVRRAGIGPGGGMARGTLGLAV